MDKGQKGVDQINPDHYKKTHLEVIRMQELLWGTSSLVKHCQMTAFKYRMRAGTKKLQDGTPVPGTQDLEKADWYEEKAVELKQKIRDGKGIQKPTK